MKKSELKNIIKDCVKEVLFEDGVLSDLIAEVAYGITKAQGQLLEENRATDQRAKKLEESTRLQKEQDRSQRLLETKKKMLNAIGSERMKNAFEGTEPLRSSPQQSNHSPLSGKDPRDAGVDISGLFGLAGQKWQQLK